MTRQQHKPQREPRTLAQQLGGAQIDCMVCEQAKPAVGSRPFHAWAVCAARGLSFDGCVPPW